MGVTRDREERGGGVGSRDDSTFGEDRVIRLGYREYAHILNRNTGVTTLRIGPKNILLEDHEECVLGPEDFIVIPPRHYVIIDNPVVIKDSKPETDSVGQVQVRHGDREIRFEQPPFALYPGEEQSGGVTPLKVVEPDTALRLKATRDFIISGTDQEKEKKYKAGDEWYFYGPDTYIPRVEVEAVSTVKAMIIEPNAALRLRAKKACKDHEDFERKAGEEWLVRESGAYIVGIDEVPVGDDGGIVKAMILTEQRAVHLKAQRTFTDIYGIPRKAGDEWLVTLEMTEAHIPDVHEEVVEDEVEVTTLTDREWCVVLNPVDQNKRPQWGKRENRVGRTSFFLHPGEELERTQEFLKGIRKIYVLKEDEALLLKAIEDFTEGQGADVKQRKAGDLWMIRGTAEYIPPVEVEVVEKRQAIPLSSHEGIYVRNIKTGKVELHPGADAYMLTEQEELWEKVLPEDVEILLSGGHHPISDRGAFTQTREARRTTDRESDSEGETGVKRSSKMLDPGLVSRVKTQAVIIQVPQNTAVHLHDYESGKARVVMGPDSVMLKPYEEITILSLSGGKPKEPNQIKAYALQLGPDFMTDIIEVETRDHARLKLTLSYNWRFVVPDPADQSELAKLFAVPDFVGDGCKRCASRVRGAVAGLEFDEFHRSSARTIRVAIFGQTEDSHVKDELKFPENNLVITNVDIRNVEPVDAKTKESLQESVTLAIKITTDAQKQNAEQKAAAEKQGAAAELNLKKISSDQKEEQARGELIALQAANAEKEMTAEATAGARAKAEAAKIEGLSKVELARQEAEAQKIAAETELELMNARQEAEFTHMKAMKELEVDTAQKLSEIGGKEFRERIEAIGPENLAAIAKAGPELQVELMKALSTGTSMIITDGKTPLNLLSAPSGLLGFGGGPGLSPTQLIGGKSQSESK